MVGDFLRYQLMTYPFANRGLHEPMRRLLNLEETRASLLLLLRRRGTERRV